MDFRKWATTAWVLRAIAMALVCGGPAAAADQPATNLWDLAKAKQGIHRFSTLFTAQQVRDLLSTEGGIDAAIDWCRKTAVTKVYVEAFRDGYQAKREALRHAKERFQAAGFEVSGCVTTTDVGKRSTGWKSIACYTDAATQERLQAIFEYAAGLFDEIMIDDFWFTDCQCPQCDAARKAKTVTVGERTYPVAGDTWEDYRCELMVRLSQERLLAAAKRVNPKARLIIKYPQWYDQFHERGYEVLRETADFDRTWVGTETRDYQRQAVGRHAAVRGLFHHAVAGRDRRPEMRRRLVRPLRHDRADLPGAGPADRAGRRPRVDALLLRVAPEWTPARRTSRPCGRTSPSCWPSPSRSAAARSWAWPPTSPPTAIPGRSRGCSTSWACWDCRWCPAMSSPPRPRRPSSRSTP